MKNAKYQVRLDKETVSLIIEKIYKAQEGLTLRCHATSEYNTSLCPICCFLIQLPDNELGKAIDTNPNTWALTIHMEYLNGVSAPRFYLAQLQVLHWLEK